MNKNLLFIFISIIAIVFTLVSTVEAKRFGGGSSFGSKKSYSSPYKQNSTTSKSFSQQKATASNQQRKQQLASRGGLMGMLGGLALGGLLGALFFGGAFENFNFFDFLIIGGIIFAVIWFMKRNSPAPQAQATAPGNFDMNTDPSTSTSSKHGINMDKSDATFSDNFAAGRTLSDDNNQNNEGRESTKEASFAESFGMGSNNNAHTEQSNSDEIILPSWFVLEDFLSGARSAYTQLQEAWDKGDLEQIRGLTTDKIYEEISRQFAQEPSQGATRILQLDAKLVEFNELGEQTEAAVIFDALLGEADSQGNQERATQVRELWHFARGKNSTEPTWYLDGIQQLE